MRPFHWLWKPQRKSSPVAKPSRRGRHSGLPLERLEDRLAPANASIVDNTLTITFNDPSETVTVANGGTSLTLTGSAGINSTSKPSQAFFTADFNRIVVLDSVAGTGQTLNFGSGSILALTGGLDVTGVETVSFGFGINTSGGTAALSVVAPRTISVGAVTLTGGSGGVTLTAQGAIAANYSGVVINGSTITTAANGNVNISGTGGSGPSNNNVGVRLESNALVTSGGTGTVTVSGTGGSGTGTGHEGVVLFTGAQIRSGGAGTVSVTGTGGANSLGSAFGVRVNATTQISSGTGGNVIVQGTGGGGSGDYQIGVDVDSNAVITSGTGGTVSVTGTGGAGIGNFHYGVWVFDLSSRITSGGGAVSVTGTGTSTSEGVRLENTGGITSGSNAPITVTTDSLTIASGLINSGSGTTTVRTRSAGTLINLGGADVLIGIPLTLGLTATEINTITAGTLVIGRNDATASGAIAVSSSITPTGTTTLHLRTGSTVIASGLAGISETNLAITAGGNVSLTSTGTGTNVTNVSILSASGSITFTGDPDGFSVATVNGQSGVSASGDITLTTIGTNSDLTVTASNPVSSSTGNVALNAGRTVTLSANVSATGAGTLTVSGNSGAGARNILVNSGVQVISDFGLLTLDADQGSPVSGADVDGVLIDGGLVRSTGGSVTVQGRGFGPGAGVRVQNAGVIRAGGITTQATVVGNSGSGGTGTHGVVVIGSNSRITSDGGNVAVTGTSLGVLGGNSTAQQYGVLVHQSAGITAGGTGSITVSGTGGSAQGGENHGVNVTLGSAIASAGGPVNVSGTGGGGGPSFGVQVADGSVISAGGSASTTVVGLGGLSTSGGIGANGGSIGVRVFINARIGGNSSGAVEVTGTSRATGGNNANIGVLLDTSVIESSGGPVTVIGTSTQSNLGPDHGVAVFNTSTIGGGSGAVVIQGTTSSGLANSFGVSVGKNPGNNGDSAGTVSSTSSVLIEADRLDVTTVGTISAGTGSVTLRGRTAARPINLGGADGTDLGLTDAELDRVTAGTLVIGSATAGAVTVSAAITRPASTAVELRSGADLVISGGQLNTAGGTLFLSPGSTASVQPTLAGIDLTTGTTSFTSGADLAIQINGTTLDTQYTQLRVAGTVDLTGVDLILSGSYTSVADDSFVIVQATSRLGTFNGLPDGTTFTYRGRTLRIDYTATQVILTDLVPATLTATVDGSGNLTVTDVEPGGKHNVLKLERGLVGLVDSIILSDANERFASAPAGWTLSADRRSISTPATFTGTMTIDAAEGNDSLTIHHGGGDPLAGGVTYHGGAGGTDSLAFTGSLLASATLTHASTSAGSAVLDGQALSYTGLESPIAINPALLKRCSTSPPPPRHPQGRWAPTCRSPAPARPGRSRWSRRCRLADHSHRQRRQHRTRQPTRRLVGCPHPRRPGRCRLPSGRYRRHRHHRQSDPAQHRNRLSVSKHLGCFPLRLRFHGERRCPRSGAGRHRPGRLGRHRQHRRRHLRRGRLHRAEQPHPARRSRWRHQPHRLHRCHWHRHADAHRPHLRRRHPHQLRHGEPRQHRLDRRHLHPQRRHRQPRHRPADRYHQPDQCDERDHQRRQRRRPLPGTRRRQWPHLHPRWQHRQQRQPHLRRRLPCRDRHRLQPRRRGRSHCPASGDRERPGHQPGRLHPHRDRRGRQRRRQTLRHRRPAVSAQRRPLDRPRRSHRLRLPWRRRRGQPHRRFLRRPVHATRLLPGRRPYLRPRRSAPRQRRQLRHHHQHLHRRQQRQHQLQQRPARQLHRPRTRPPPGWQRHRSDLQSPRHRQQRHPGRRRHPV
ncbi:MAG: hypothetical protein U0840_26620 [Gemmataceae bacterium]